MTKKDRLPYWLSSKVLLTSLVLWWMNGLPLYAQVKTVVQIVAENSASPLAGVTLHALAPAKKSGWLTDTQGKAYLNISEPVNVKISYLGYLTIERQIVPGSSVVIQLEEDILGLDEVVVTGSFTPTTSSQALHSVKKIGAATIEAKGAVNLADVLQTQLNLKIIQDDVLGSRVVMQGISGPNVKILIDGVPVVNGSGGNFDLSQLNMNNVERVEIVEGPLSVQYGTNALAGTINIITKSYQENESLVSSSTYYESVGQYNVDVALAKGWKNLSVSAGGGRNRFDGFSSSGERNQDWIPRTQYLANAKVNYHFKSLHVTGSFDHMWQKAISHGDASGAFNSKTGKLSLIADDHYFKTYRLNSALIVNGHLSDKQYINIVNGVSRYTQAKQKYLQDIVADIKWISTEEADHDTSSFITWTSRGTYVYGNSKKKKGLYLTVGYELSRNSAQGGKIRSGTGVNVNDYGVFTALEIPVGNKLKIQPALRYTYSNKYDSKEINFLNTHLPLLPSFNLKYHIDPHLDFRFSYGQGYRTPSVRELYYEFINANHYIVGNAKLQAEIGHNINFSGSWRSTFGSGISVVVTPSVFLTSIDNKIELVRITDRTSLPKDVPKNVPVARTYANIKNFKSFGFNLNAKLVSSGGIQLSPGFGLLSRSGSESDYAFYTSYEMNLNASYFLKPFDVKFNIFYKYNGRITEFAKNEEGAIGVLTLEAYNTLDFTLSKSLWKGRVFTSIGAKNLFDVTDISLIGDGSKGLVSQTGRESYYPISWGRTFFIKFNYTIH
ncbi:TonB-dependent receptor [Rapidithrix thailandica]|uniref:TonB-dependent receptor n=1 Tax=Rapidithrix thailandica TaxID=413964 RepID=A0AAW9SAP4_9BACT